MRELLTFAMLASLGGCVPQRHAGIARRRSLALSSGQERR
jgi:hypothetical protein